MRSKLRRKGSVLRDLFGGGRFGGVQAVPAIPKEGSGAGEVTSPTIHPGAVQTPHVGPKAITGPLLADGAFDITKFAAGIRPIQILGALPTLPDANYPEGAHVFLTTDDKLYRSTGSAWTAAVPAVDVTGQITETQIADDAITTPKLATNAVTADEIAANAVTSAKIIADGVVAGKIAAAAVNARELAAGAVTTEKLTVGILSDSTALNSGFEEAASADSTLPAYWRRSGLWGVTGSSRSNADKRSGDWSLLLNPGSGVSTDVAMTKSIPVAEGDKWYLSFWAKGTGTGNSSLYARLRGGTTDTSLAVEMTGGIENVNVPSTWTKYEAIFTIAAGVTFVTPMFLNYSLNTGEGVYIDDVSFQKAVGTANIIDANIINAKIANLTLTADKYQQVRNVIEIPFDDSLDPSFPLECFFQMPTGVVTLKSIKVWIHKKPFRRYVSTSSSTDNGSSTTTTGGGTSHTHGYMATSGQTGNPMSGAITGNEAAHTHALNALGNQNATHNHSGGSPETQNHSHSSSGTTAGSSHNHSLNGSHVHDAPPGIGSYVMTGSGGTAPNSEASHTHGMSHSHSIGTSVTPGIFESGGSGTINLYAANDGVTYGASIASAAGTSPIDGGGTGQTITGITSSAGSKRIRINSDALMRVQVLIVMDLILELGAP